RGDHATGLDAGDSGVLVPGDPELAEDLAHVLAALGREPVAEPAVGGEGDLQVGAGFGDLGGGLQTGQAAADDEYGLPGVEATEAFAQPQRPGSAGHLV